MSEFIFSDKSFDDPEIANEVYQQAIEASGRNFFPPKTRENPCSDCAADGLYGDITMSCRKYLTQEQRQLVVKTWDCHNGGRCEGAAQQLLGEN